MMLPVVNIYSEYCSNLTIAFLSYGGPRTQTVSSKWSIGWDTYLASQRNFIVASVDVRGTGFQGDDFKHAIFRKLGSYEVSDTIHVIRYGSLYFFLFLP